LNDLFLPGSEGIKVPILLQNVQRFTHIVSFATAKLILSKVNQLFHNKSILIFVKHA
jgi:hypothetical protein